MRDTFCLVTLNLIEAWVNTSNDGIVVSFKCTDFESSTMRHAQGKREIMQFSTNAEIRHSMSTIEVERQDAMRFGRRRGLWV